MRRVWCHRLFLGLRVTAALLCAGVASSLLIEQDAWVREQIGTYVSTLFGTTFDCRFKATVAYMSLIQGRVVLVDCMATENSGQVSKPITARAAQKSWFWMAPTVELRLSYLSFLVSRVFEGELQIPSLTFFTHFDDHGIAAAGHVQQLLGLGIAGSYMQFKACTIEALDLRATHTDRNLSVALYGSLDQHEQEFSFDVQARIPALFGADELNLKMRFNNGQIDGLCSDVKKSVELKLVSGVSHRGCIQFSGQCGTDYVRRWFPLSAYVVGAGSDGVSFEGSYETEEKKLFLTSWIGSQRDPGVRATAHAHFKDRVYTVQWRFCNRLIGAFKIKEATGELVYMPDYHKRPLHGSCAASVLIPRLGYEGWIYADAQMVHDVCRCTLKDETGREIECVCIAHDPFFLRSLNYQKKERVLVDLTSEDGCLCSGVIHGACIDEIAALAGLQVQVRGECAVHGTVSARTSNVMLSCTEGIVQAGHRSLVVQQARGAVEFDPHALVLQIRGLKVRLQNGSCFVPYACAWCHADKGFSLKATALASIAGYRFALTRDVGALVSGQAFCSYDSEKEERVRIVAVGCFDQGFVKENIFSLAFPRGIGSSVPAYRHRPVIDLTWFARKPIIVRTNVLKLECSTEGHARGFIDDPTIEGSLNVVGGSIGFPYKPLFISSGRIDVMRAAGASFEKSLSIALEAKNVIKTYAVTLSLNGLLPVPHIELSSYPSLLESQIVTLLYAGSDEGTLACMVPQALLGSLKGLLLNPVKESSVAYAALVRMLRPFENVRIIPRLSERSGRGGLKGAVEIEVGDRVHAKFEKDFELSEDVAVELGYDISDNATARLIKDARGDYGIEIGGRWHT